MTTEHAFLDRIAERHEFPHLKSWPEPWIGATSRVWPCGEVVIKVPFETPDAIRSLTIDAAMSPVARELGVCAPALVTFDDRRDLLSVPYAIFRRVQDAVPLAEMTAPRSRIQEAWKDAGRNLARIHAVPYGTPMPLTLREFRQSSDVDPRPWARELHDRGRLDAGETSWLLSLLDDLADTALADIPLRLCHGDINASNILVPSRAGDGVSLIDWAGAGWLDPAWDFAGVPLAVVPHMLQGHRDVAPLPYDETVEARILWYQLQTRLFNARTEPEDAAARSKLCTDMEATRAFVANQELM